MTKPQTVDLNQIIEARDYHVRQVQRYDDALALLRGVAKLAKKADTVIDAVRKRRGRPSSSTSVTAQYSRAGRAREKTGSRPLDLVRAAFAGTSKPLTRDELLAASGLVGMSLSTDRVSSEGQARRMLGLMLGNLQRAREIRETKDGYVAVKLQAPARANGAGA